MRFVALEMVVRGDLSFRTDRFAFLIALGVEGIGLFFGFGLEFFQRVLLFFELCEKSFRVSVVLRNYCSSLPRARRADRSCSLGGDNPLRGNIYI